MKHKTFTKWLLLLLVVVVLLAACVSADLQEDISPAALTAVFIFINRTAFLKQLHPAPTP